MPGADEVNSNLMQWVRGVAGELWQHTERTALEMETTAKTGAPWKDQTSQARRSIEGHAEMGQAGTVGGDELKAVLSAGMEYSPYLEFGTGPRGAAAGTNPEYYGFPPHSPAMDIYPKKAKALHWVGGDGKHHFARKVHWIGMGPRQILIPTRDAAAKRYFDGAAAIVRRRTE